MNMRLLVMALVLPMFVAGCNEIRNEQAGAVVGGVLGGVLGSNVGKGRGRTAAIIAGTMAGAYIGGNVGRSMDENDRHRANSALENKPTGEVAAWRNPDTGNEYQVTPTRTYEADGGPCREYTTEAVIEGRNESVTGTACRQPDGSWQAI